MMLAVSALFLILAVLIVQLLSGSLGDVVAAFSSNPHQTGGAATAIKYAISNGGYLPLLLYCAIGLKSRSEAFTAGIVAALVAVLPALVFHFAFMASYPAVIDERLPTYFMFGYVSTPLMLNIYVLVMFVLVAQTGVGLIQGLLQRIDGWKVQQTGLPMTRVGHATVSALAVSMSLGLGTMGIVALILRGYTIMFYSFIVVYIIPLFTYGIVLIYRSKQRAER